MNIHRNETRPNINQEITGQLTSTQVSASEMKLGQLLVESEIINPDQLFVATRMASQKHQALATIFHNEMNISEQTLRNCQTALTMIEASFGSRETIRFALHVAHVSDVDFIEMVERNNGVSELESLLIKSGIATGYQLKEAKRIGSERNMQLAVSLLRMKAVPFTHLNYALECLHLIHESRISIDTAVKSMALVRAKNISLNATLCELDQMASNFSSQVKIGDLLLAGRVINEFDMLDNVEQSISSRRLVGSLLVESGLVSNTTLKDILQLQSFCIRGVIDQRSAVKLLRKTVESNEELQVAARCTGVFADDPTLAELALAALNKAGFITLADIESAVENFSHLQMGPLRALVAAGVICASARKAALECAALRARNLITEEDAIFVLHYCDRNNTGYEEAFAQLGISKLDDRKRMLDQAISSEFNCNKSLLPKLHKSLEFFLIMLIGIATVGGAMALRIFDPTCQYGFATPSLLVVALFIIFRLGQNWFGKANRKIQDNAIRVETARCTVSRLSPSRSRLT